MNPTKSEIRFSKNLAVSMFILLLASSLSLYGCRNTIIPERNNIGQQASVSDNLFPPAFASDNSALSVPDIVKKVQKAVVGVSTKSIVQQRDGMGAGVQEGIGSGFIINNEGYVLTNYHVIAGAQEVKVICSEGYELNAKVVNYDSNQDIAMVKITENIQIPGIVELGDSDQLQVGESVVAIGNPLGKEFIGTVTTGIVSAVNRGIEIDGRKLSFIQTDAAINPGNSGGPLLNTRGQVIGINTAKIGAQGIEGIGFSIPINTVKLRLQALSKQITKVGIAAINITDDIARQENLPIGVYVKDIQPKSAAAKAGLQSGDIITKFDGTSISTVEDMNKLKENRNVGDSVNIEYIRGSRTVSTSLILGE